MIIIAERINASRKPIKEALKKKDADYFLKEVQELVKRGSNFIDLNTSNLPDQELPDLLWLIDLLKDKFEIPLAIDSSTPSVIEAGLKRIGRPGQMINSITLNPARHQKILPLALEHQALVIALLMDENDAPKNSDDRLRAMERLTKIIDTYKIPPERVLVDALVFTLSTEVKNGLYVLETIRELKKHFPQFKTLVGLSNVSFGLPDRRLLNRTFLAMLLPAGLDAALIDPLDDELMATLRASMTLSGQDPSCLEYLQAFRRGELGK